MQFEVKGDLTAGSVMLTLRTDTPMGVQGSLAFFTEDGPMLIPFHQNEGGFAIHDMEPLDG